MSLLNKASILTTPTAYENGKILSVKPSIVLGEELVNASTNNLSGWIDARSNANLSIVNNNIRATYVSGTTMGVSTAITTVVGKTYSVKVSGTRNNTNGTFYVRVADNSILYDSFFELQNSNNSISADATFVATQTTHYVGILATSQGTNDYIQASLVSVKEVLDADFDFTRNSSATRVNSQGLIEDMQILSADLVSNGDFSKEGSELVTNGDFATNSDWNLSSGATISNGKLIVTNAAQNSLIATQSNVVPTQKPCKLQLQIVVNSGSFRILMGSGGTSTQIFASGTYTFYETSGSFGTIYLQARAGGFDGSIDNVSVKEVGQDWALGASWSIGNNKATRLTSVDWGLDQTISSAVNGRTYRVTTEITDYTSGVLRLALGSGGTVNVIGNALGVYVNEFVWTGSSGSIIRFQGDFVGSISNITILEITEDTNLPRIDYTGGEGHWLFEPQSTQTATYSNDFTQGDIFASSSNPSLADTVLTSQQATSPDGTNNAWKLVDSNDGLIGQTSLNYFATTVIANNYNTISYFVKKQGSNNFVYIVTPGFDAGANGSTWFDIQNGTLGNVSANHTANIQNYGNGWYRISITMQATTDVVGAFVLKLATSNGVSNVLRDGTNGVYLFGTQAESDASRQFMTSYIPTSGSTVTRLADAAFGAGSSDLINSTEGVLYAEIAALANDSTVRRISLTDGTVNNRVEIAFFGSSNRINVSVKASGTDTFNAFTFSYDITQFNKIAIKYKVDDFNLFVNGVKLSSDTSGSIPTGLDTLNFNSGSGSFKFFGKTKCVAVFKEALTDAELTCLTTI